MSQKLVVEFSPKVEFILERLAQKNKTDKITILRRAVALLDYVHEELENNTSETRNLSITENGISVKDIILRT